MPFMLTRIFAYFTLFTYLVVGSVCVRLFMPEIKTIEISSDYLSLLSSTEIKSEEVGIVSAPELSFAEIKFPAPVKVVAKVLPQPKKMVVPSAKPVEMKFQQVAKNELPFSEPVVLNTVVLNYELPQKLASLYVDFKYEMIAAAEEPELEDEISTSQAADAEPEFFEYKDEKVVTKKTTPVPSVDVADGASLEESTTPQTVNNVDNVNGTENAAEEVAVDDLIAFDYSKAEADVKAQMMPTVSIVNTHPMIPATPVAQPIKWTDTPKHSKKTKPLTTQQEDGNDPLDGGDKNDFVDPVPEVAKTFPNRMTIQLTGTNLEKTKPEVGFEIRFQDDLSEAVQDYNSGEISIDQELAQPKMNRSITVLKLGFAPTNTDLILEEGVTELTIPAIEEDTFNELLAPYESRGPIGAVLVELDAKKVEGASLDVPYSQVLKLTENMALTEGDDFTYQLFVGVKAGNAMLSYKGMRGDITSKIIHVHEREVTFESNFFEDVSDETVTLLEEDLMAKEMAPLILSAEEVKQFATTKTATKLNDHTYKTDFNRTLLGARKYLELSHQSEPVFVGFKEAKTLNIPSENFMRYILSKFEGGRLGNRCLVQVNLTKKAVKVDVGAESVGSSLMTYTQILDADGKFYDSISSKSAKIIVVGENQGAPDLSQDGKINLKITYQDGSIQYLGSYCSPNTYLVEQL